MTMLRRLLSMLALLVLAACGGAGGDGGSPFGGPVPGGDGGSGGGGTGGSPTVALGLSSSNVTAATPATLTATVRDATGQPVSGVVVSLSTVKGGIGQLSAVSVLTDAAGMGTVSLAAAGPGVTGADEVVGVANLGTTTVEGKVGFSVTGASATLQAMVDSTTLRASAGPVRFSAVVRDAAGKTLTGQIVSFASATGAVKVESLSALTDAAGVASTTVTPADASLGVADTLVASTTVNGVLIQSSVNVQVISETPSIWVSLSPSQVVSASVPATVQAVVRNAAGAPVSNAVVSFSTQFSLGSFSATTAATATGTGAATVVLKPATASTAGADVLVATVNVGGVTTSAQRVVEFVASVVPTAPTLLVELGPTTTITPQSPGTVTVTLVDGSGSPVRGAVVSLSTARGTLAVLSASSVLTGDMGKATAALISAASGFTGADDVVARATVGGTAVQGNIGFAVTSATSRLDLVLQPDADLRASAGPATLLATVRNASGQGVDGQFVSFESADQLVTLSARSAVTRNGGVATVTVTPKDPTVRGADSVRAYATLAGKDVESVKNITVVSELPQIAVSFAGSSTSTIASPAQVRAMVRDIKGNPAPDGTIVRFSTQSGLGIFDASSVATSGGVATTSVAPVQSTTNGADLVLVAATVDQVPASGTATVQFVAATSSGAPSLKINVAPTTISAAAPGSVTATLKDSRGEGVGGQLVSFTVVRGLAKTNVATALTNSPDGVATVQLTPTSPSGAGADEITASASFAGRALQDTIGFQINATDVTIAFDALSPANFRLSEYGQTTLTLKVTGASVGSPVNLSVTSSCVFQGKATLSPATFTTTANSVDLQYLDNGCGALQSTDELLAVVVGSANTAALSLPLSRPGVSSLAFVQATPESIYLRGSGFTESSLVTFEVRDASGNPLPNELVSFVLLTGAGGVTMEGNPVGQLFQARSNAQGLVSVRVNSGTQPTPVRVQASITLPPVPPAIAGAVVSTVSSNLSVGIGLPSQLNFSLSQSTKNIEGYNIDGTTNSYQIIAADRSGNPVPEGTSINFVTEGGQVEAIKQTQIVNGIARTTANFVSSEPRPVDGRVTITSYALGEESFIDLNGNNKYDEPPGTSGMPAADEPFQDLGNIFKDRNFDGLFDDTTDEFVPLEVNNKKTCVDVQTNPLLRLDASIPSMPGACDGVWSGAGQVYVRRATETVLSTSGARPLWPLGGDPRLLGSGTVRRLQVSGNPADRLDYRLLNGDTLCSAGTSGSFSIVIADANPGLRRSPFTDPLVDYELFPRLNPMAALTSVTAGGSPNFGASVVAGSPVPSTTEASVATISFAFLLGQDQGTAFIAITSPSGTGTATSVRVVTGSAAVAAGCP